MVFFNTPKFDQHGQASPNPQSRPEPVSRPCSSTPMAPLNKRRLGVSLSDNSHGSESMPHTPSACLRNASRSELPNDESTVTNDLLANPICRNAGNTRGMSGPRTEMNTAPASWLSLDK